MGLALPQVHPHVKLEEGKALPLDLAAVFEKLVLKPRCALLPMQHFFSSYPTCMLPWQAYCQLHSLTEAFTAPPLLHRFCAMTLSYSPALTLKRDIY